MLLFAPVFSIDCLSIYHANATGNLRELKLARTDFDGTLRAVEEMVGAVAPMKVRRNPQRLIIDRRCDSDSSRGVAAARTLAKNLFQERTDWLASSGRILFRLLVIQQRLDDARRND